MNDDRSPDGEDAIFGVERLGQRLVAPEQEGPQPEQLDLFGVFVVSENVLEIQQAPRLGRAPIAHPKCDLRIAHLGNRGRERRE